MLGACRYPTITIMIISRLGISRISFFWISLYCWGERSEPPRVGVGVDGWGGGVGNKLFFGLLLLGSRIWMALVLGKFLI